MKRIYMLLLILLLSTAGFAANKITVLVVNFDVSHVKNMDSDKFTIAVMSDLKDTDKLHFTSAVDRKNAMELIKTSRNVRPLTDTENAQVSKALSESYDIMLSGSVSVGTEKIDIKIKGISMKKNKTIFENSTGIDLAKTADIGFLSKSAADLILQSLEKNSKKQ